MSVKTNHHLPSALATNFVDSKGVNNATKQGLYGKSPFPAPNLPLDPPTRAAEPLPVPTDRAQIPWRTIPCVPESCYESPETAKDAVNMFAARHGYSVVSKTAIYDKKKKIRRIVLACNRHGTGGTRRRSQNCGCPMEVNLVRIQATEGVAESWQVQHRGTATRHNHPPSTKPLPNPKLRRATWTEAARRIMETDARSGVPVKQTLGRLAQEAPGVLVTAADLYEERRRLVASEAERRDTSSGQTTRATIAGGSGIHNVSSSLKTSRAGRVATAAGNTTARVNAAGIITDCRPQLSTAPELDSNGNVFPPGNKEVGSSSVEASSMTETAEENWATDSPSHLNSTPNRSGRTWNLPCLPESSFKSPEAVRAAVNSFASRYGYAVVHRSTKNDKKNKIRRIILACDRHGVKRQNRSKTTRGAPNQRTRHTRRCGCPMRVNVVRIGSGSDERWQVQHRGIAHEHNHPPSTSPSDHPILRRESRTQAFREIVAADAQAEIPVAQTLERLVKEVPGVILTARDVYNQRRQIATSVAGEVVSSTNVTNHGQTFDFEASPSPLDREPPEILQINTAVVSADPPPSGVDNAGVTNQNPANDPQNQLALPSISKTSETQQTWKLPCLPESSFASLEAARAAVNAFAGGYGYAVVHRSTKNDNRNQVRRVILACDRHGSYRQHVNRAEPRRRVKPTRRCGCPMTVNIVRIGDGAAERWQVQHRGTAFEHNHPPSKGPSDHPVLRRESCTEGVRQIIATDAQAGIPVSQTLARLAVEAPGVILTARDVYNLRHSIAKIGADASRPPSGVNNSSDQAIPTLSSRYSPDTLGIEFARVLERWSIRPDPSHAQSGIHRNVTPVKNL
ncbi:unnamed protein product [Phytophthora lilii]|uniref:Unnamed protein product n=1 Tax=Phytophthora lilii TaxID=2077276 RepID=A0A9W6U8V4_9STRA|nr:unnamed protein product [Phytophthora lilii]